MEQANYSTTDFVVMSRRSVLPHPPKGPLPLKLTQWSGARRHLVSGPSWLVPRHPTKQGEERVRNMPSPSILLLSETSIHACACFKWLISHSHTHVFKSLVTAPSQGRGTLQWLSELLEKASLQLHRTPSSGRHGDHCTPKIGAWIQNQLHKDSIHEG